MVNNRLNLINAAKIPIDSISDFEKYIVKENDILIAMSGATTGKVGFVEELNEIALLNQRVGNFKIKDESILDKKFLYYFIISDYYQKEVKRIASGCAQPNISAKKLESVHVSIPSMEMQKQIAKKLEIAEKVLRYRNQSLNLSNMFLESLFIDYFGDLRYNDKDWEISELKDVCNIVMGQSPPGDSYNNDGIGKEFFQGKAEFGEMYPTVGKWTTEPKRIANKGSILFSVRAPVGSVNIANIGCCIGRGLAAIESGDKLNNLYLFYYFKMIEDTIASRGTGSTFKSINKSQLSSLKVPVPPIELQNQFAEIVQQVEEIKKHQLVSKVELENLFNNLMQKAFRGE